MRALHLLLLVTAIVLGLSAEAKVGKKKSPLAKKKKPAAVVIAVPTPTPDIAVEIPKSPLNLKQFVMPDVPVHPRFIEVSASSWSPREFNAPSFVAHTTPYRSTSTPRLSLNTWTETSETGSSGVFGKFGVTIDELTREGHFSTSDRLISGTQTMNLISLRFGAEVAMQTETLGRVRPFADLAFVPTYAQAPSSMLSDGTSRGYAVLEGALGLEWRPRPLSNLLGTKNIGFAVGLEATQGVFGSPLTGTGIFAGTRVSL